MYQAKQQIHHLLDKMQSADKDFRFMATNDLMGELQKNIQWDDDSETKITSQILGLLQDKNGEIQNLAVKCLGFLVSKFKDDRKKIVVNILCQMLKHQEEPLRDIALIALKTVVSELPTTRKILEILNNDLNPNLILAIADKNDVNVQLESLDILTEMIIRFGSQITHHHEKIQQELLKQLDSERSAIRKRSMNALSYLLLCCSDDLFNRTMEQLLQALAGITQNNHSNNQAKTILQCIATITRLAGHRTNISLLNEMIPVITSQCYIQDDELREQCLQAFEAYARRCPVNIKTSLPEIIKICVDCISYDPNYNYDCEDNQMDLDSENESDSGEDYSDDDDISWKVRRASAKCLEAIVLARRDMTSDFFQTVVPILVSRFKEREETVKADIIQTFVALLRQIRSELKESRCLDKPAAVVHLTEMIPTIIKKSSGLLRERAIKTRQVVIEMYTEIINIIPNALSEHVPILIPCIICSLTDKNSTSNMKIEALLFLQELIKSHDPTIFYSQLQTILPPVIQAVDDPFYKIASEALALLSHLVCVVRPSTSNYQPMSGYEPIISQVYEKTLEKLGRTDVDIEIKERGIECMGEIARLFGDIMGNQLSIALNKLHEKLGSETTRLIAVKALIKIANSPIQVPMDSIFPKAFEVLSSFLRKNSRQLKISTLMLIENVVKRSPNWFDFDPTKSAILAELPCLVDESDLYVSQLALTTLTTIIRSHKDTNTMMLLPDKIYTQTLQLVRSPLLQGTALNAMLHFFTSLVESPFLNIDQKTLLTKLVEPFYTGVAVHKQAYNFTAKSIAAISVGDKTTALTTVQRLVGDSIQYQSNDTIFSLILLSIGEIGRVVDLAEVANLLDVLLLAFKSSSEDVKSAGSYALGCVAVGNMDKFLPIILQEIEARNKRQYLTLHSLREVISASKLHNLETIWNLLIKHCECEEEGTRNVVSECLGKLTLIQPKEMLPRLIEHLKNDYADKPLARSTIVASIKFIISDQPQDIDNLLRQCIGHFLMSLQDPDLNVRRVALITLNSAAHNKPSLIVNLLPQLLPLLYKETQIKPELIRQVEMGPFKHQVDDGLDSRKAAFECMYTLLDSCQNHLDIFEFLKHVEDGLQDHYDIKMLTYLILNRLAALCPSAVLQRMDGLISQIELVCRTKPKENSVKQEFEKQDELKRSALKAFEALKSIPNADRHPAIVNFFSSQ